MCIRDRLVSSCNVGQRNNSNTENCLFSDLGALHSTFTVEYVLEITFILLLIKNFIELLLLLQTTHLTRCKLYSELMSDFLNSPLHVTEREFLSTPILEYLKTV